MEQFCYKQEAKTLFLRGTGRLTSQNCEEFKKTVFQFLNNPALHEVLFDLSDCNYMDSTFLGMIVGIYKKMKAQGKFSIVKPSEEAIGHLHSMGIDRFVPIQQEDATGFPAEMGNCRSIPTKDPESILSAHQNLVELSAENAKKFALLINVLENQVAQKSG